MASRTAFFAYVATFAALQAQTSQTQQFRIENDATFEVQAILMSANFSSGVAFRSRSNIAGGTATGSITAGIGQSPVATFESVDYADMAKLYRDAVESLGTVTNIGLHLMRLAFQDGSRLWQNAPMRADLVTMEPGRSLFLPSTQLIAPNTNLSATLYNDMPTPAGDGTGNAGRGIIGSATTAATVTIDAQVILLGRKIYQ